MDRKLTLSRYKKRYDKGKDLDVRDYSWDEIVELLTTFKVTSETFDDYKSMDTLDKLAIKDVGYFVGGKFDPPQRKAGNLKHRSVLTLDLDHLDAWDIDTVRECYRDYAYILHSSHSHSDESPRLRIIFPFTRDVKPEEYEPIARMMAKKLDLDLFDDTTYQFSRVMFLPSRAVDGDELAEENFGEWVDPDVILGKYKDWTDFGTWPQSSREKEKGGLRERHEKAANPFEIPGIIGAFNRAFPIDELIADERFGLPYTESGKGDDRYTYLEGTSADGAIFYPDDGHLFSHHESDPAHGNHNAWDLVRLHRFGDFTDTEKDKDKPVPVMQRESSKQMKAFALSFDEVQGELQVKGEDEFDDLGELEVEHEGEKIKVKKDKISFDSIMQMIYDIREDTHGDFGGRMKKLRSVLAHIAAGSLASDQESVLIAHVKAAYPDPQPTKKAVEDSVKALRKGLKGATADSDGNTVDIEEELVEHVVKEHFAGGTTIRRINRAYWCFTDGRWAIEDEERVVRKLDTSIMALRKERPKDFKNLVAAVAERSTTQISASLKPLLARRVSEIHDGEDPLQLNRIFDECVFNLRNCEIHVNDEGKHQVRDHEPANFYDIRLNVDYDKEADAPEWDQFCELLFSDSLEPEEMKRHLEELLGYILQYRRWMKHFAIFMGYTDAGKSTIVDMLKAVLDTHYTEAPITMFSDEKRNQFTNMHLLHSLLLVDEERSKSGLLPDSALKSLAEEKPISTEIKYAGKLNFVSRVFPLIVSNQWPRTGDIGEAFTRRALVWHFKHELPAKKRSDAAKAAMLKNTAGFFNRCLAGLKRLRARGKFDVPFECEEAKGEWMEHCNPFLRYLAKGVDVSKTAALKDCVTPSMLYSHWGKWCDSEGISRQYQIKRQQFWEQMALHGHEQHASGGERRVKGITGVRDIDDEDFD